MRKVTTRWHLISSTWQQGWSDESTASQIFPQIKFKDIQNYLTQLHAWEKTIWKTSLSLYTAQFYT